MEIGDLIEVLDVELSPEEGGKTGRDSGGRVPSEDRAGREPDGSR